jgi:hypothetical protein
LGVIPGKVAIPPEGRISLRLKLARPGIHENQKRLDTRFAGMTVEVHGFIF